MSWQFVLRDWTPHTSHKMSTERTEIRCPGSEPRFYGVRTCEQCEGEEGAHPAGHYADDILAKPCVGAEQ
jgi:hypothetical protein